MALPSAASKANCDASTDDPKLAILTDLAGVIDKFNLLLSEVQPISARLTTLSGISAQQATDLSAVSTFIGTLLDDASAAAARETLKLAQISPVTASVAANALTLGLNATALDFRSATLTTGVPNARDVPSAISLVVPSGATLGTVNATAARLALLAIDNAGTVELAVVNLAGGNNLDETTLISTTSISTSADSSNVIYSTTARTSVPFRVVGFIDITEATAGTWATAPTLVHGAGGNSMASLGTGQTWQDVTGSRALSATYYNTTGRTIFVNATQTYGSVAGPVMTINGEDIRGALTSTTATQSGYLWPIPAGASYLLAGGTLVSWKELR